MMSRKHYIKVAKIIKDNTLDDNGKMLPTINKVNLILSLGTMFKEDNNNFDRQRFNNACYDDEQLIVVRGQQL